MVTATTNHPNRLPADVPDLSGAATTAAAGAPTSGTTTATGGTRRRVDEDTDKDEHPDQRCYGQQQKQEAPLWMARLP